MQLTIAENERAFDNMAAWKVIGEILRHEDGRTTLQLGTGKTSLDICRAIADIYAAHPFRTARLCIFGTGEIAGRARSSPQSCYYILEQALVKPLGIYEENFIMPMPFPDDPERECRAHESVIAARGGIDLLLTEPREDGGIDLLRPGRPFGGTALTAQTDGQTAMTLGMGSLMHSRKILLAAKGRSQAEMVKKALQGPVTEELPVSLLRLHPSLEVILDREAASLL